MVIVAALAGAAVGALVVFLVVVFLLDPDPIRVRDR